jgi:hypothetical protein
MTIKHCKKYQFSPIGHREMKWAQDILHPSPLTATTHCEKVCPRENGDWDPLCCNAICDKVDWTSLHTLSQIYKIATKCACGKKNVKRRNPVSRVNILRSGFSQGKGYNIVNFLGMEATLRGWGSTMYRNRTLHLHKKNNVYYVFIFGSSPSLAPCNLFTKGRHLGTRYPKCYWNVLILVVNIFLSFGI